MGYDEVLAKSGMRQAAFTQRGIALIFVLAPAILTILLILVDVIFPMTGKEFSLVQKEIARRKGEDKTLATQEEKEILKKVTGFEYVDLWSEGNTSLGRRA